VTAGIHTLKWEYSKDGSVSGGSDAVWIDDIFFPPFNLEIPDISVSPSSHDFGTVDVGGSSSTQTFTISNAGAGNLTLGTTTVSGTDASHFVKQNDGCSGQMLPPAGSCTVDVRFSPQSAGGKSANLSVPSSDPDTPTTVIALAGTGTTPLPPVADFSGSPVSGAAPLSVNFTDLSTNTPTSRSWTFGDGGTSAQQNPSHIYQNAGTYTVSLTATNVSGSDIETKTDYITVSCPAQPVRITGAPPAYYSSLQTAYDAAVDGDTLQAQAVTLSETIDLNSNITVILKGGYDACYTVNADNTTINGSLTISDGTVEVQGMIIAP
jgi:PKD repeat protein